MDDIMTRFKNRERIITAKDFEHSENCPCCAMERRYFLRTLAASTAGIILPSEWAKAASSRERRLNLYNTNTGEKLNIVYWTPDNGYVQSSLNVINNFFRDHRENAVKPIDTDLLNILNFFHANIGYNKTIKVNSGFRTEATNQKLAKKSSSVGKKSYHMRGMAADIQIDGFTGAQLKAIAKRYNAGGIGTYTSGEYIHVDSGPVREWRYK